VSAGEDENRERFDKFAGSEFERPKAGPEGAEGRMPGVILPPPPDMLRMLRSSAVRGWLPGVRGEDENRERFDKFDGNEFERPKAGPEGAEGRMPGVILPPPPDTLCGRFIAWAEFAPPADAGKGGNRKQVRRCARNDPPLRQI